jgi:hypothetical protein
MPHAYVIYWRIAWPICRLFSGPDNRRTMVRLPAAGKGFSLFQNFRIGSGIHLALYVVGTDGKADDACKETIHLQFQNI